MSLALLSVTLVLVLGHFRPQWGAWRQMSALLERLQSYSRRVAGGRHQLAAVVIEVLLPGLLLFLLQLLIDDLAFGLLELLYGVTILFLCWGPRDLDMDVAALREADDAEARARARQQLGLAADTGEPSAAVCAVFRAALDRWFGPLLWFVLLGGAGAVMFRLLRLSSVDPVEPGTARSALRAVFEWPVAQLMTLALALVGNFDAVATAWRSWHLSHGKGWLVPDVGFLDAAARRSVDCELREQREEQEEMADQPPSEAQDDPLALALIDSMSLVWRILLAWMVVFAMFVIAGIAS